LLEPRKSEPKMRNSNGYRNFIAWQKANFLAHFIYNITQKFPKEELFGLTSQMRRCALSVCANIAEGYSRKTSRDKGNFYHIAIGSLTELEFFIDFAFERKYITQSDYVKVLPIHIETAKVLRGLLKAT